MSRSRSSSTRAIVRYRGRGRPGGAWGREASACGDGAASVVRGSYPRDLLLRIRPPEEWPVRAIRPARPRRRAATRPDSRAARDDSSCRSGTSAPSRATRRSWTSPTGRTVARERRRRPPATRPAPGPRRHWRPGWTRWRGGQLARHAGQRPSRRVRSDVRAVTAHRSRRRGRRLRRRARAAARCRPGRVARAVPRGGDRRPPGRPPAVRDRGERGPGRADDAIRTEGVRAPALGGRRRARSPRPSRGGPRVPCLAARRRPRPAGARRQDDDHGRSDAAAAAVGPASNAPAGSACHDASRREDPLTAPRASGR